MNPSSHLLPEVSGFTVSFIAGRAGRGWNLNRRLHTPEVEWGGFSPKEWTEMKWNAPCR